MAEIFYYKTEAGNFGDDLNLWLWDHLLPGWQDWNKDVTLFGVGTLLNEANLAKAKQPLILGSGTGYGPAPATEDLQRAKIEALRGPRTAQALGCDPSLAVIDPAALIPRLELPFLSDHKPGAGGTIFIPHHHSMFHGLDWSSICAPSGIRLQSPADPSEVVIRNIAEARLVIAESMHAAIIADAFRVPWVPVRFNPGFNLFKWQDWGDSLDVGIDPLDLLLLPRKALAGAQKLRAAARSRRANANAPTSSSDHQTIPAPAARHKPQIEIFANRIRRNDLILVPYIQHRLRKAKRVPARLSDQVKLSQAQDRLFKIYADIRQRP